MGLFLVKSKWVKLHTPVLTRFFSNSRFWPRKARLIPCGNKYGIKRVYPHLFFIHLVARAALVASSFVATTRGGPLPRVGIRAATQNDKESTEWKSSLLSGENISFIWSVWGFHYFTGSSNKASHLLTFMRKSSAHAFRLLLFSMYFEQPWYMMFSLDNVCERHWNTVTIIILLNLFVLISPKHVKIQLTFFLSFLFFYHKYIKGNRKYMIISKYMLLQYSVFGHVFQCLLYA